MAKKVWKPWTLGFTKRTSSPVPLLVERMVTGTVYVGTIRLELREVRRLFQKLQGDYRD